MRWAVCLSTASTILAFAGTSSAQGSQTAESLFQEARTLVEKGQYAAACPKLEESERLDPAVGTQFNLADCYEHVGRTATAYALFHEVASIARSAGKFEREKSARERANALEPRLARVRIVIAADAPGLEVQIDDKPVERSKWNEPMPIDPGRHRVTASAPEHVSVTTTIDAAEARSIDAPVPALAETNPRKKGPLVAPARGPSPVTYVAGGIAIAALATGAVAGIISLSKRSDAENECPKDVYAFRCPTPTGADAWNSATTAGTVSTVGFVIAGVALAATAVLWIVTSKKPAAPTTALLQGRF